MEHRFARHARALVLVAGLATSPAIAQTAPEPRVNAWGAMTVALPQSGGTLDTRFEPSLTGGTRVSSLGTQSLGVDTTTGLGGIGGLDLFVGRHLGLQVAYGRESADVQGEAGTYTTTLRYTALQPPSGTPQAFTYERTASWPAATGTLTTDTLALGAVARWRSSSGTVGGTVSGGASLLRYSGDIEAVALTRFMLGGHATLLPVTHAVRMTPSDATAWRPYVGADLHVRVASRAALFGGIRATLGSDITVGTVSDGLTDPSQGSFVPDAGEIDGLLGEQPLTLPGMRLQVLAGVKLFVG